MLQRALRYGLARSRYLPSALLALGEAIFQCWTFVALVSLAPLILSLSGQGRQALFIATDGIGLGVWMLLFVSTIVVVIYASLLLDLAPSRAQPERARRYAMHCAPQILAVSAVFSLPLVVRHGTGLDLEPTLTIGFSMASKVSLGFFLQALQLAGPFALLFPELLMSKDRETPLTSAEIAPLGLIGLLHVGTFFVTDESSVLARYLVLVAAIVLANWFFPGAYRRSTGAQRDRLAAMGWVGLIYSALVLAIAARIAADPVDRAPSWGPMEVVLISILTWLCVGFIIDWGFWWLARRRTRRPLPPLALTGLRLAIFAFITARLLTGSFGDAILHADRSRLDQPRQTLSAYLDRWLTSRRDQGSTARPYPIFIVTAEGGGIRAAYWTATVLGALQDRNPEFADHVLALSGVSGGSVGASVFAAMTAVPFSSCRQTGGFEACAQQIGGGDMLSAPLASLLIAEPFRRLTGWFDNADRYVALEDSLERAWRNVEGNERFREPFQNVAAGRALLLPNATSAGSGQRLVITGVDAEGAFDSAQALDGRVFSLSSATLLSARFPLISPAALHEEPPGNWMRIVDGGYSDNSGAATGSDVLKALIAALQRTGLRERFQPVVLAISNSPSTAATSDAKGRSSTSLPGAILDPVLTLDSVRGNLSRRFEAQLRAQVIAEGGSFLSGMRLLHGDADLPLGWMLAPRTAAVIDQRRRDLIEDPDGDFRRVGALLGPLSADH